MLDKQKTFRYQLVMLHHVLTKNIGGRDIRRAIEDIVKHELNEKDLVNIDWKVYIGKPTYKIFRDILTHSKMIGDLYHRHVFREAARRAVLSKPESDRNFHIQLDQTVLANLTYVKDTLLDQVCQLLASGIQDFALGREVNADGKTGSTLEKIEGIIRVEVTNMNVEIAKAYKRYETSKLPQNQQRLTSSSSSPPPFRTFSQTQLRALAVKMFNTSVILQGYNQLTYYLYNERLEVVKTANEKLTGMSLDLHPVQSPYYAGNSVDRKETRWKQFNPVIKTFYETELTTASLTALAEEILGRFYSDQFIPVNRWDINLKIVSPEEQGVYNTKFSPPLDDAESWSKINTIFDGFCLAHAFVRVLHANNLLLKLNPYIFLYDNVADRFSTYDDLVQNSNDYVKLRAKFLEEIQKKEFMIPAPILSESAEELTSRFSPDISHILSWKRNSFVTKWTLTGREHAFAITSLVIRAGEGLHPAVVLFPNAEAESKQDTRYFTSKDFPVTQPPCCYDADLYSFFIDSGQLNYYEGRGLDWSNCFDASWDAEFVAASREIVPNRHEYFAILLLIIRVYNKALYHLNPSSGGPKTTIEKTLRIKGSIISDLLWTLDKKDGVADVFSKLQDIVSDIPYSEERVHMILKFWDSGLCRTLEDWLGKCRESLMYIRNVVYDAKMYSKAVKEHVVRPPVIDQKVLYKYSLAASASSDPRIFSANFPKDIWEWDEETTYGYLVRKETGEYETKFFDGVKHFLHHSRIWVGGYKKVVPWQSGVRIADSTQESQPRLLGQSTDRYLEGEDW